MSVLAIKGHATRGKEVIEILEMLGGKNKQEVGAIRETCVYFIDGDTISLLKINQLIPEQFIVFTLEEFIKKFPYKVGDKAFAFFGNKKCTIIGAVWDEDIDEVVYTIKLDTSKYTTKKLSNQLQPYKEETMEEIKIDIPKGYEFAGVDDDKQQVVFEKIKPQYPKTYEECCEVLFPNAIPLGKVLASGYNCELLKKFGELLICRNAYWKIAGEQMSLGKPWSPSKSDSVYCIFRFKGDIVKDNFVFGDSLILEFPTEEMRDAFYENFRDLLEQCKELL